MTESPETTMMDLALGTAATGGLLADAVKKGIFHGHGVDWRLVLLLAESLRLHAGSWALLAERELGQQGLFNVTLEPTLFGDRLPGDVADGVAP